MSSTQESIALSIAGVSERDVDLLLLEEFSASPDFARWFAEQVGLQPNDDFHVITARRSVTESIGESDLEVAMRGKSSPACHLLIENKIGAAFQPRQADRYRERGRIYQEVGACQTYITVLVAPSEYFGSTPEDRRGFDAAVTYEKIRAWFAEQESLGSRSKYKQALLTSAIEKAVRGYQVIEDAPVTDFWRAYWLLSIEVAPELEMPEPVAKPARAGFVYFRPSTLPRGVAIVHKLHHGYVDLQFAQMAGQLSRLRSVFGPSLTPGMSIERAAKSGVIRQKVPVLATIRDLQSQYQKVVSSLERARELLRWYLTVRPSSGAAV